MLPITAAAAFNEAIGNAKSSQLSYIIVSLKMIFLTLADLCFSCRRILLATPPLLFLLLPLNPATLEVCLIVLTAAADCKLANSAVVFSAEYHWRSSMDCIFIRWVQKALSVSVYICWLEEMDIIVLFSSSFRHSLTRKSFEGPLKRSNRISLLLHSCMSFILSSDVASSTSLVEMVSVHGTDRQFIP